MASEDNSGGLKVLGLLLLLWVVVVFGSYIFSHVFPQPFAGDPRVAHRSICTYLDGEQQGNVCVKDGEVVEIDLSNFKDD